MWAFNMLVGGAPGAWVPCLLPTVQLTLGWLTAVPQRYVALQGGLAAMPQRYVALQGLLCST